MEIVDPKQPCLPLRYQRCVPDMKPKVVPKTYFLQTRLTDYYRYRRRHLLRRYLLQQLGCHVHALRCLDKV